MTDDQIKSLMTKYPSKALPGGLLRTCPVRLSYPHIFQKTESDGEFKSVYDATLLFPLGADMSLFEKAVAQTAREQFGPKITRAMLRWPINEQGKKADKDGYVEGAYYFRATSDRRPGCVNTRGNDLTEDDVYPGCWVVVTVRPFAYDNKDKGVSFGLQNVVKVADDESFGASRTDAHDDFADILDGNEDASAYFENGKDKGGDALDDML